METTKLWIHIGMPKTGTTSLQDLLAHNRACLADYGYLYPDFGHNQHFPVVRSLARESGSPAGFPPGGADLAVADIRTTICAKVKTQAITDVVLSSEFFFDYAGLTPHRAEFPIEQALPHLRGVAALLRDTFYDFNARVIVWLRRQDQWLMSMYNNVVKGGNFRNDFDTFYKYQVAPWYGSILDQWADIFGTECVLVFVYQEVEQGNDIVPQFLNLIGFPNDVPLDVPPSHVRAGNIRLSRELLIIKRELNQHMPDDMPGLRQKIEDLFFDLARREKAQGKEDSPILSRQECTQIMDKFAEENQRVLDRFFDPSRKVLFPEPPPTDGSWQDTTHVSGDTLLQVFAPLLMTQAKRIRQLENRINNQMAP